MTNDTTTLQGSLVEMKDRLIYELGQKGVTVSYDSTTGLLGLIGKISEIQQDGSCYHIEFSKDSYTAVGGAVTLECTLQQNYEVLSGATVTLSDGTSLYSSITNQNGIATFNLTGLSTSTTYTCTYNNVSDTCNVDVVTYYFIDDCSVDNTSNYTSYSIQGTSGKVNILYDSVETAYKITNNTTSGRALLQFGDTVLQNNVRISADIKLGGTSYKNNGMLAFIDKDSQTTYSVAGWVQGQKYYRLTEFSGTSELQTTSNTKWTNLSTSDYNHHELTFSNGVVTYTITNPSNVTKTVTLTLQQSNYIGGKLGLFVEVFSNQTACYIKNIIAKPI